MKYLNLLFVFTLTAIVLSCGKKDKDPNEDKSDIKPDTTLVKDQGVLNEVDSTMLDSSNIAKNSNQKGLKTDQEKKYYLIVGSFKEFDNAQKMLKKIDGTEVMEPASDFNRVFKAVYTDKNEAIKALKEYRKKHKKVAAWLYYE